MNRLQNIFKDINLDKIPSHIWDESFPMCWYPSSGYDFRHIFFWDFLGQNTEAKFPKIFIHTDFTCLNYSPYPIKHMDFHSQIINEQRVKEGKPPLHPLLKNGYILDVFGDGNCLTIKTCTELFLKEDVFFPNKSLFQNSQNIGDRTHKVHAINCQIINLERDVYSLASGDIIKSIGGGSYTVINPKDRQNHNKFRVRNEEGLEYNSDFQSFVFPNASQFVILLFTMENYNFFYDIILKNNLKIDYLTHINDGGGSMGGSKEKMDFIYLYAETIGLSKIIIDYYTMEEKKKRSKKWSGHYRFNPKVNAIPSLGKETDLKIQDWNEHKIFFPYLADFYIKAYYWKQGGHESWKYFYFNNEPISELPNINSFKRKYEDYYFYERK